MAKVFLKQASSSAPSKGTGYRLAAVLSHPETGRSLEVWSDQAGLEFYTGNFFPPEGEGLKGKHGVEYCKWVSGLSFFGGGDRN